MRCQIRICNADDLDCIGECFGLHVFDEQANPLCCLPEFIDCSGVCFGNHIWDSQSFLCCEPWEADCAGECGGSHVYDLDSNCCTIDMLDGNGYCSNI